MGSPLGRSTKWMLAVVMGVAMTMSGGHWRDTRGAVLQAQATGADKEDDVDAVRIDVYVLTAGRLNNPIGFCTVEPCDPDQTLPTAPLFNINGTALGMTWGDFQTASARSTVSCKPEGTTSIRVRLSNLRPNSVYSLFYVTLGPDSVNPYCSDALRDVVVPERCTGAGCVPIADSRIETDDRGEATYVGEVAGCLLDAQHLLLDVIYHSNGVTYGALPNQLASETQHPAGCPECNTQPCLSSFGRDAMRQAVIVQKRP